MRQNRKLLIHLIAAYSLVVLAMTIENNAALIAISQPELTPTAAPTAGVVPGWQITTINEVYNPAGQFYTYAPSVMVDGEIERIWTCHNNVEGQIKDHIYYTERVGDAVVVSRSVLSAGPAGAWDSYHVCDPSVITGEFRYQGQAYSYALFYLGNDVDASLHNQIGVAFANDPATDSWVKYPTPVIAYDGHQWGVGQPSAISLGGGRVLLFYTKGHDATITFRQILDLSDMDSGPSYEGEAMSLTNLGLTGHNGRSDYLNNIDVVFVPQHDRFYVVREQHPYPRDYPNYIGQSLQLVSISAERIWRGGGRWTVEGEISPEITGLARNHNGGIARTPQGTLPDPAVLRIVFSDSCAASPECVQAEWTYDLWEAIGVLND
ncbi:MAG: hypothetical protein HPY64_14835 [Anaerolineae bacterium]|nr:hypothetical protein [Anaerolineae bacterium]